jgi:uncharacterized protein
MLVDLVAGQLSVDPITVAIADLPATLSGVKLVQMSDFHYDGKHLSERLLMEAIAASNQAEPDLVFLTGDFISDNPAPIHQLIKHLKYLQSRAGVFAVLGNHDIYVRQTKREVMTALTSIGIQVLWNEIAYPLGIDLPIVGLADLWSREFNPAPILAQLDPSIPRIILSHNPDTAALLQKWRGDLQLSGHTHGGQIYLPGIGSAPMLLTKLREYIPQFLRPWIPLMNECDRVVKNWQWARGLHQVGKNQLYVNRGLGTYFPGRLFCPPEVTVITLAVG